MQAGASHRGPPDSVLTEQWAPVLLAVSVEVRSKTEVLISVPAAAELLLPSWDWWVSRPPQGHDKDPQWLARLLTTQAHARFLGTPSATSLMDAGGVIAVNTVRHKKTVLDLGETQTLLRNCRSDRAALTVEVTEAPLDSGDASHHKELAHTYCAMGVRLQHEMRQTVLCRVYNMELAACYLFALQEFFGISLKPALLFDPS